MVPQIGRAECYPVGVRDNGANLVSTFGALRTDDAKRLYNADLEHRPIVFVYRALSDASPPRIPAVPSRGDAPIVRDALRCRT